MEMREPAILLNSVLLPTLGLPTIAATVFAIIQTSFLKFVKQFRQQISPALKIQ
jgi:hypothetical protein